MMPMAITMGDASGVGPEIILRRYIWFRHVRHVPIVSVFGMLGGVG